MTTDQGDASGTGYYSPARREWLPEVAQWALGRCRRRPAGACCRGSPAPSEVVGRTASGAALGAGTGDNMAAAVGLGLVEGDVAVSIGTSGTAFCVTDTPAADPTGSVAGFADATGRYLPLVATVNAARVLAVVGDLLGVDHAEFGRARAVGAVRCRRADAAAVPGRRADAEPAAAPPAC